MNLFQQLVFVEAEITAVIDQRLASDDNRAHIAAHRSLDERSDRIPYGAEGDVTQVDNGDVGFRSFCEPPDIVPAKHPRAAERRGVEYVARVTR